MSSTPLHDEFIHRLRTECAPFMAALTKSSRFLMQHCPDLTRVWYYKVVPEPPDGANALASTNFDLPAYTDLAKLVEDYGSQPNPYLFFPIGDFAYALSPSVAAHPNSPSQPTEPVWTHVTLADPDSSQTFAATLDRGDMLLIRAQGYHLKHLTGIGDVLIQRAMLELPELLPCLIPVQGLAECPTGDAAQIWKRTADILKTHLEDYFTRYFAIRGHFLPGGLMIPPEVTQCDYELIVADPEVIAAALEVFNWSVEQADEVDKSRLAGVIEVLQNKVTEGYARAHEQPYRPATEFGPSANLRSELTRIHAELFAK